MKREKRIQLKKRFATQDAQRDMFGTPFNRAKTWGRGTSMHDVKKTRQEWKRERTEF